MSSNKLNKKWWSIKATKYLFIPNILTTYETWNNPDRSEQHTWIIYSSLTNITFCSGPSYFVSFNVSQAWLRIQPDGPLIHVPVLGQEVVVFASRPYPYTLIIIKNDHVFISKFANPQQEPTPAPPVNINVLISALLRFLLPRSSSWVSLTSACSTSTGFTLDTQSQLVPGSHSPLPTLQ